MAADGDAPASAGAEAASSSSPREPAKVAATSSHDIERGCRALSFLADRELVEHFVYRWYAANEGTGGMTLEHVAREWLAALWEHHGRALASRDSAETRSLCELLWRNTREPVALDSGTTGSEFARATSGPDLRWQTVGCVAALVGLTACCLPGADEFLARRREAAAGGGGGEATPTRTELGSAMWDVASTCLDFCRACNAYDDMFLWLVADSTGILLALHGNRHHATYRSIGECIDCCIGMGLHQADGSSGGKDVSSSSSDVKSEANVPFWLSEVRKRALASTYSLEIGVATFLGRPPRMHRRYLPALASPPLDLSDDELFLQGDDLAAMLSQLDGNGWNVAPGRRMTRTTRGRVWLGYVPSREAILDLALTANPPYARDEVMRRADDIHRDMDAYRESLPPALAAGLLGIMGGTARRSTTGVTADAPTTTTTTTTTMSALEQIELAQLRMGSLGSELLLQRVLMHRAGGGAGTAALVRAAREMLGDMLALSRRRDLVAAFEADVAMMLVCHGLRSAAILAVELLRQERRVLTSQQGGDGGGAGSGGVTRAEVDEAVVLPRGQTIMDLTVFAERLANVDPGNGVYEACVQGRRMLTAILDRILTPGAVVAGAAAANHATRAAHGSHLEQEGQPVLVERGDWSDGNATAFTLGQQPPWMDSQHQADMSMAGVGMDPSFGVAGAGLQFDLGDDMDFSQWLGTMNWGLGDALGGF